MKEISTTESKKLQFFKTFLEHYFDMSWFEIWGVLFTFFFIFSYCQKGIWNSPIFSPVFVFPVSTYIPPPCSTSHFAEKFYLLLLGREMSIICITIHKEKTGVKVFVWISSSGKLQILVSFLIRLMILAYHFKTI